MLIPGGAMGCFLEMHRVDVILWRVRSMLIPIRGVEGLRRTALEI